MPLAHVLLLGLSTFQPGSAPPCAFAPASEPTAARTTTPTQTPTGAANAPQDAAQPAFVHIDGEPVPLSAYLDYLWSVHGTSLYDEFVHRELVERAAARAGIAIDPASIEQDFEPFWQKTLAQNPGGEKAVLALLQDQGKSLTDVRRQYRVARRLERLEDALCQRTRTIDEAAVRARFDRDYGKDGIRVELAHIFLHRAAMRAELAERGVPAAELTLDRLDRELAARAQELMKRLASGADFAALAQSSSHDQATRDGGGVISGYNYDRYGDELARAVRAAAVGAPFGPVHGAAGVHIGLVRSRVETKLNEVRDPLLQRIARDPASPKERMELRQRLRAEAQVEPGPAAAR